MADALDQTLASHEADAPQKSSSEQTVAQLMQHLNIAPDALATFDPTNEHAARLILDTKPITAAWFLRQWLQARYKASDDFDQVRPKGQLEKYHLLRNVGFIPAAAEEYANLHDVRLNVHRKSSAALQTAGLEDQHADRIVNLLEAIPESQWTSALDDLIHFQLTWPRFDDEELKFVVENKHLAVATEEPKPTLLHCLAEAADKITRTAVGKLNPNLQSRLQWGVVWEQSVSGQKRLVWVVHSHDRGSSGVPRALRKELQRTLDHLPLLFCHPDLPHMADAIVGPGRPLTILPLRGDYAHLEPKLRAFLNVQPTILAVYLAKRDTDTVIIALKLHPALISIHDKPLPVEIDGIKIEVQPGSLNFCESTPKSWLKPFDKSCRFQPGAPLWPTTENEPFYGTMGITCASRDNEAEQWILTARHLFTDGAPNAKINFRGAKIGPLKSAGVAFDLDICTAASEVREAVMDNTGHPPTYRDTVAVRALDGLALHGEIMVPDDAIEISENTLYRNSNFEAKFDQETFTLPAETERDVRMIEDGDLVWKMGATTGISFGYACCNSLLVQAQTTATFEPYIRPVDAAGQPLAAVESVIVVVPLNWHQPQERGSRQQMFEFNSSGDSGATAFVIKEDNEGQYRSFPAGLVSFKVQQGFISFGGLTHLSSELAALEISNPTFPPLAVSGNDQVKFQFDQYNYKSISTQQR
eukprot:TRINITY_DN11664_c0_g1_i1.p1 TRINITY_DN11664_c0_g1~~TRINITY_DN11664_c0_g1_i1.p1  ORF type:complete len:700 (+),score=103.86 TRINITY_DN11664_c0_g1_i1:140-2239(+)